MYCSGCGQPLEIGQQACARCGRPAAPAVPPSPAFDYQLASYAGKVRVLAILWFVYAAIGLVFGIAGVTFAKAFFSGGFGPWGHGPWMHGPMPPMFGAWLPFAWLAVGFRAAFCAVAAWGLMEHTHWGRIVAIIAAILSLFHFPFGTALGVATLVILLGYRNATLYEST